MIVSLRTVQHITQDWRREKERRARKEVVIVRQREKDRESKRAKKQRTGQRGKGKRY